MRFTTPFRAGLLPLMSLVCLVSCSTTGAGTLNQKIRPSELAGPDPEPSQTDWLLGTWVEEFVGRGGCSDVILIARGPGGTLVLTGSDCNDQAPYVFEAVASDGRELTLRLIVPETQRVLAYRLGRTPDGTLEGVAEILDEEPHVRAPVRWVKRQ